MLQRLCEACGVGKLNLGTHTDAVREAGDLHAEVGEEAPEVECGRITLDVWVGCEDHFFDAALTKALEQWPNIEVGRSHAIEG